MSIVLRCGVGDRIRVRARARIRVRFRVRIRVRARIRVRFRVRIIVVNMYYTKGIQLRSGLGSGLVFGQVNTVMRRVRPVY